MINVEKQASMVIMGFIDLEDQGSILMLDYDGTDLRTVMDDVKEITEKHNLQESYILKTKNGYHVYNPSILPVQQVRNIVGDCKGDRNLLMPLIRGYYGLRVCGKKGIPRYAMTVQGASHIQGVSKPHLDFLKNFFKIDVEEHEPKSMMDGSLFFERISQ